MPSAEHNGARIEWSKLKSVWNIIIPALVVITVLPLLWRSCSSSASSSAIADMLVIEPVGSIGARQVVHRTKGDAVRIQWCNQGKLRDTMVHYGTAGDEEEEVARILSNADRMTVDMVQRGLKTIIWRSVAIEIDTMFNRWSLITVGSVPFHTGLIEAEETEMLRRNPKLQAWFFVPPIQGDSLAVTDTLIKLLRNEGVDVKREILR